MEVVQEHQGGRFKFGKRKKSSWLVEMPEENEKKGVKKNVIDMHHVKVILILLLKTIFHQKIPSHSGIAANDQVASTCFQTVQQTLSSINLFSNRSTKWSLLKKVVLREVYKLNESVMNKNHRDQTQFSPEKRP